MVYYPYLRTYSLCVSKSKDLSSPFLVEGNSWTDSKKSRRCLPQGPFLGVHLDSDTISASGADVFDLACQGFAIAF